MAKKRKEKRNYESLYKDVIYVDGNVIERPKDDDIKNGVYVITEIKTNNKIHVKYTPDFDFRIPEKLYGDIMERVAYLLEVREELGTLLSLQQGKKGMGKTVLASLVLEHYAKTEPVFIIKSKITNGEELSQLLDRLRGRILLIDEFDKFIDVNVQKALLPTFGTYSTIITLNDDNLLIDEFKYRRFDNIDRYNIVDEKSVTEFLEDRLDDEVSKEKVDELLSLLSKTPEVTMANIDTIVKHVNIFHDRDSIPQIVNRLYTPVRVGDKYILDGFSSSTIDILDVRIKDEGYGSISLGLQYVIRKDKKNGFSNLTLWNDDIVTRTSNVREYAAQFWSAEAGEVVSFKIKVKEVSGK